MASVEAAISAAGRQPKSPAPERFLSWEEVTMRLLEPRNFTDTAL
jgi:hypothetical protein